MGWDDANSWVCKQPGCGGTAGDDGYCHTHPPKRPNTSLGNELPKDLQGPYRRNRYLTKSDPEHPCHRGCTCIWKETAGAWVCIYCDEADRSRPAPAAIRPLNLPPLKIEPWTPVMPEPSVTPLFPRPQVTYEHSCCMCTDPQNRGKALGLVCHCPCHPQITC